MTDKRQGNTYINKTVSDIDKCYEESKERLGTRVYQGLRKTLNMAAREDFHQYFMLTLELKLA